jgi:RNA polymerase sigma-70 factor (ECF subfamily)
VSTTDGRGYLTARADVELSEVSTGLDAESAAWLEGLRGEPAQRNESVRRLHALLLRATRWQLHRMQAQLARMDLAERDTLAEQAADDATVAVLSKLDDYAGHSRFTTWVFKFAILHMSVAVRRSAWRHREVPTEPASWPYQADSSSGPEEEAEGVALARALRTGIDTALTPHQRDILIALAINDVPVDVLAERLGTTRGALYKTLHDARARLRVALHEQGIELPATRKGTR